MPFGGTAHRRIAGHQRHAIQVHGNQQRFASHSRAGQGRLAARVARAHHNNLVNASQQLLLGNATGCVSLIARGFVAHCTTRLRSNPSRLSVWTIVPSPLRIMNQLKPRVNSNERKSLLIPLPLGCQGGQQALLVSCTPPVLVVERWGKSWSFCVDVAVVSNVSDVSVVVTIIVLSPGEVRKAFAKCEVRTREALL